MMQIARVVVLHHLPGSSHVGVVRVGVSLPAAPFPLEIDPLRRDTAPRAAITRLPARKRRIEPVEPGIMDMGDLA